jgi:dTMP kinase
VKEVGKGVFVCVEGLDGCGKTTQARLLVRRLGKRFDVVYTAEPSGGRIGRFVRRRFLHGGERGSGVVEALLFAADRFEHVHGVILPALDAGKVVVCDRYVFSSLAYQGAAGVDLGWIEMVNRFVLRPDLAVFVDVDPEVVVGRLRRRRSVMEDLETQRRVRDVYFEFLKRGDLVRVDGNRSRREVGDDLLKVVEGFLEKARS